MEPVLKRRSSLFEFDPRRKKINRRFPEEDDNLIYPLEYVQNLNNEVEQWKCLVTETCDKRNEDRKKIQHLKSTIFDENVLSQEQKLFLESVNDTFQKYLQTAEAFCKTLPMLAELRNYHHADRCEVLAKSLETQQKIKLLIRETGSW